MILSDRTIREQLEAGRITIEPFDESCIQPSSVDVRLDRSFRVFLNHTMPVIDVKKDLGELTRLVEVDEGDAFILHPGEFVLASTLERVALPDDLVARVEGKALSLGTPVPTPCGWTTIGDINVGDLVYGDTGCPVRVKDVSEVMLGRPCAEVLFSDGTVIVADEDHRWVTTTRSERRAGLLPSPRTTRDIAASLRDGRERNHHVPIAGSIQCPDRVLPIHPYVLGLWLGDGTSTAAQITTADPEILDEIRDCGYAISKASGPLAWLIGGAGQTRDPVTGRYMRNESLSSTLRNLGLFGNKHVPADYLRASVQQRWWLLEGLMDSDGYCDKWGRCEYTTVKEHLAEQVHELVCSLGFRAVIAKKRAMLRGVDHGPSFEVTFTPDRPVFRLHRKLVRQREVSNIQRFRAITEVRAVSSVSVRCIEVDSISGIFLVGRTFVPTHNSSLGRLGLLIHSTAGFVDAGFAGHLTLELSNVANLPITLYPGMKIGQLSFMTMTTPADRPYGKGAQGSKYHGQRGPTPSRYFENFD